MFCVFRVLLELLSLNKSFFQSQCLTKVVLYMCDHGIICVGGLSRQSEGFSLYGSRVFAISRIARELGTLLKLSVVVTGVWRWCCVV